MIDNRTLAAALINTRQLPAGLAGIRERARESWAYHRLEPYPAFAFGDWKREDRGPLPKCLPIARSAVKRGARWLFGKPLELRIPDNDALEEKLTTAWRKNRLASRLVAMAERAALEGGIVLKFSYDEAAPNPISFQSLSLVDQVRLYYHPHDRDTLLLARVQYPFFDAVTGKTWWYREEWTEEREIHYVPVSAEQLGRFDPDVYEGWAIDDTLTGPNPFGLIPLQLLRNYDADDVWGQGDLWDLYRVLDRVHLTYHLMDKSNQFDSEQNPIFIDAEVDDDDIDKPLAPGQPVLINSREDSENRAAKVTFPPSGNGLRPAMMEYAKDLKKQILAAASSVEVDQAEFTNKGNLTNAVLAQLYLPQIEATEDKRKTYGEEGIVLFLQKVAVGLSRIGVQGLGVNEDDEASYTVELGWADFFEMAEEEKAAKTARIQEQEVAGYLAHDRAVEEISEMEDRDAEAVKEELEKEPRPSPTEMLADGAGVGENGNGAEPMMNRGRMGDAGGN